MNKIDQAIADWRRHMAAGGVNNPPLLDELESHLREEIRALVSAGTPEAQAVPLAISRLGRPGSLRTEFDKVKNPACWPVKIGFSLWVVLVLGMMLTCLLGWGGKWNVLLAAHIFSVTTGYGAAFVAGSLAACYVCCRSFRALSLSRQQSLATAVTRFSLVTSGVVSVGWLLGALWSWQNHYPLLVSQEDPRAFGGLCVALWFAALAVMLRRGRLSERAAMLWCIGGCMIVSLAWFGGIILVQSRMTHQAGPYYLPIVLSVLLGLQAVFLVLGLAPVPPPPDETPS